MIIYKLPTLIVNIVPNQIIFQFGLTNNYWFQTSLVLSQPVRCFDDKIVGGLQATYSRDR